MKSPSRYGRTMRAAGIVILALASFASDTPTRGDGRPTEGVRTHPRQTVDEEAEGIRRAVEGRSSHEPELPAIRRAIDYLERQAPREGEVFALIKITDRESGARQYFTRGTPSTAFGTRLLDESLDPAELVLAEESEVMELDGVEIAIRSQISLPSPLAPSERDGAPPPSEDEEETTRLQGLNADSPYPFRIGKDLRDHLARLDRGAAADGARFADREPLDVAIRVRGVPPLSVPKAADPIAGGHLMAALEVQAQREQVIAERKLQTDALRLPVEQAVRELGGQVRYGGWLAGTIVARLAPAALLQLAEHPAVLSIEEILQDEPSAFYDGSDIYDSTNQSGFTFHEGWNSAGGKFYTSRMTIGMVESCIREDHPAWLTGDPTSARRARFYDIDPAGYTLGSVENCWGDGEDSKHEHGTWVAAMMVADFMDGQEPALSTSSRRRRTGTCPECYLTFFQDEGLNNRIEGLNRACDKGVDIFQSSVSTKAQSCDGEGSYDGTLQDLTKDCGALYVQSAGNKGSTSGSCTTTYPGDHPWTLTVGGVFTDDPCDDDSDWFGSNCVFDSGSSRGGATYDGNSNTASVIDLAAPFRTVTLDPDNPNPSQTDSVTGTSFSSPIVAGLAARLMDWWRIHADTSVFYQNRMKTMMLLFGDRSAFASGTSRTASDTSKFWGAGRIALFPFDQKNGWWLRRGSVYLKKKESYSFTQALPSNTRMIKVVVWHDGKDYATEPKIKLTVEPNGCSPAASSTTQEESDSKTMRFRSVNDCSSVYVRIRNSPVGLSGSRRFHFALLATRDTSERVW